MSELYKHHYYLNNFKTIAMCKMKINVFYLTYYIYNKFNI